MNKNFSDEQDNYEDNTIPNFLESYNEPLNQRNLSYLWMQENEPNEPPLDFQFDYKTSNETFRILKRNSESNKIDEIKEASRIEISASNSEDKNKMLGKKRKLGRRSNEEKENQNTSENTKDCHDKYSNDNLEKKIKRLSIYSSFNFINDVFKKIYKGYPTKKKLDYHLLKLKHEIIKETKVEFNRGLLEKTMKWILTSQQSSKYKNYDKYQNQNLLEKSLLEGSEEDKRKLELLLNMKYIEYLDFYRGNKPEYEEIFKGLVTFEQYCKSEEFLKDHIDHEEYKQKLEGYLNNYENRLQNVKQRKPKRKKNFKKNGELINSNEI